MSQAKKRTNLYPDAYMGVDPITPLQFTIKQDDPTNDDYNNWNVGTIWLNEATQDVFMLVKKLNRVATWSLFTVPDDELQTLTGDTGGAVGPDISRNISFLSDPSLFSIDGNPGTNTLTINNGDTLAITYTTDSGNAVSSGGVLNVLGGLNLSTSGAANTITVATTVTGPGVVVTDNSAVISSINGTDGQVVIGATGADPLWNSLTSSDGSVVFSTGPNSLDITVPGGTLVSAGDNITITSGATVNLNETIRWPNTNVGGTTGILYLGGAGGAGGKRFLHNYGSSTINEQNTFLGIDSGNLTLTTGSALRNIGIGQLTTQGLTTGSDNIGVGSTALRTASSGSFNVGIGHNALDLLTTGTNNTCIGAGTSRSLTSGSFNTMCGRDSFRQCFTGNYNIGIGYSNGARIGSGGYAGAESSNLDLAFRGQVGMSNELHIGSDQVQPAFHNRCFIAGIHGVTSSGSSAMFINSTKLTGTSTSSKKFKENIETLDEESLKIMDLRPVTFSYMEDEFKKNQWGLIAEEVEKSMPEMVVKDNNGLPLTVQYHKLIPLLLKKIQTMIKRVQVLESLLL